MRIRAVYSHRMPHSKELGKCLFPEGGMWSDLVEPYSVDSHTGWHAKDPDRPRSPADVSTAALKHPKPGLAFFHCRWLF